MFLYQIFFQVPRQRRSLPASWGSSHEISLFWRALLITKAFGSMGHTVFLLTVDGVPSSGPARFADPWICSSGCAACRTGCPGGLVCGQALCALVHSRGGPVTGSLPIDGDGAHPSGRHPSSGRTSPNNVRRAARAGELRLRMLASSSARRAAALAAPAGLCRYHVT